MMKGSKRLLLLTAFLAGFGLTTSADAQSSLISSVAVTSPDSGVVRGIDSTFVVTATVTDYSASDSLEIYMYLTTAGSTTAVVQDANGTDHIAAITALGPTLTGASGGLVAAYARTSGDSTITASDVDGTSVTVSKSGSVTTFVWNGKVHATSGTVSAVTAAAVVVDYNTGAANDTLTAKASSTSGQFSIDADRPINPTALVSAAITGGETATVGGSSRAIAGIGDTLKIDTKLGSATVGVFQGDSLSVELNVAGKKFSVSKTAATQDTLNTVIVATDGLFSDLNTSPTDADTIAVYIVDAAGNLSGGVDGAAEGVTTSVTFLFDTTAPAMTAATGDTLVPAGSDTITDGSINTGVANDLNGVTYKLGEALDSLVVTFDGADKDLKLVLQQASTANAANSALGAGASNALDLTAFGDTTTTTNTLGVTNALGTVVVGADSMLKTGVYSVSFQGVDLAGNVGAVETRSNVYVDVDNIELKRLFPTNAAFGAVDANGDPSPARTDTIEEATAKAVFRLSEPADSVLVRYTGTAGPDNGNVRTRVLSGTQLTNTTSEQSIPVDSLVSGTNYLLEVVAKDLAGNFNLTKGGNFLYDTSFVVPIIQRFTIASSATGGSAAKIDAGTDVTLTIQADATTDGTREAVSYKANAILKVTSQNGGVAVSGDGVTDLGDGRYQLDEANWTTGSRTVTLKDSTSTDEITVSIVDSTTSAGPYTGALDSTLFIQAAAATKIVATAPATVNVNEEFDITVERQDAFGNVRVADAAASVEVISDQIGVEFSGDKSMVAGVASFSAKSSMVRNNVRIRINDGTFTDTLNVAVVTGTVDGPDELVAEDYMGADGMGDQGGFVMLTWDLSTDKGVGAYRIYRQVQVTQRLATAADSTDMAIVMLSEPEDAWVPWAKVDAVPGESIGRGIVATLDNVATMWAVAAERGAETSMMGKAVSGEAVDAYTAMAQTMQQSQQLAAMGDQPVFAALTPEALSFVQQGVAPRLKSVDEGIIRSALTETKEAVRAIDNIAPLAVPYLRVIDTPGDAGSSITLTWTKSEDDRMLARSASNAVSLGSVSDMVAGVKGYNIYRKVGATGEYTLVGKATSGSTSFVDQTAFNGVRYTYSVAPYDEDNVTESDVERTAMAIRNTVVDKNGKAVFGLFGADNQVGFDDFFIFADNFGLTAADESFEPAFDLAPSAGLPRVDFDDFFVFADNFGRGIEAAGKVVPMQAGLNADARLYLEASAELPRVGEEVVIDVDLADYVQMKGYGLSVVYDAEVLEYVRTVTTNSLLGEGELATPRAITQTEGQVDIAAYGETVTEGVLGMSMVFRTKAEIENTYIEVTDSQVRDGDFAVNAVALPAPVQIQTRPEAFALANNYPNPFNPATTIKYALPEASQVRLEVFNVVGQVVSTLVDNNQNAGRYVVQWDATNDQGHSLSSGIYFYRLQAGGEFLEVKKMLLLK
ncbi:MAG: FlgD immunoglobulin-like domain containing protein [Candidatus Latescibacterota bacterium]|nr:FlgD immunoglobulin-like domain containing protein [Candidatus Latescibacterota bacterium]